GLVMERWCGRSRRVHGQRVALKAEQVYVAALQQARVRRTMGGMASHAAFGLDGRMLPGERTGLVSMAIEANHILRGGGAQLMLHEAAMLVMAIAAGDEPLIHAMVKGLGKIRLDLKMAAVT